MRDPPVGVVSRAAGPLLGLALPSLAAALIGETRPASAQAPGARSPEARVLVSEEFGPGWRTRWTEESLGSRPTEFAVVEEAGDPVLRASSRDAASALTRPVAAEAGEDLRVTWRWKVARSLEGGHDERRRSGDDYAARVFVVFGPGGLSSAEAALCYVWAASEPVGATYRSPYAEEVATVVLRSGDRRAGRWIAEERDVGADFRNAFGRDPGPVSAVALMVDTDDTGGSASAWFDDVVVVEAAVEDPGPRVGAPGRPGGPAEALAAP